MGQRSSKAEQPELGEIERAILCLHVWLAAAPVHHRFSDGTWNS
jgi:hypothetical protein